MLERQIFEHDLDWGLFDQGDLVEARIKRIGALQVMSHKPKLKRPLFNELIVVCCYNYCLGRIPIVLVKIELQVGKQARHTVQEEPYRRILHTVPTAATRARNDVRAIQIGCTRYLHLRLWTSTSQTLSGGCGHVNNHGC